jgi:hypothetical protein
VRVDGRVVTGSDPNGNIAYAPRSASCALGALAPAGQRVSEVEAGMAAARASGGASSGAPSPGPAAGSGAVLQVESGFPKGAGGAVPLAGQALMLLDTSLENVLREAGLVIPAGGSVGKAFVQEFKAGAERRQKLIVTLNTHNIGYLKMDQNGIALSPELQVGRSYFVVASVAVGTKYLWNVPVTARAGWTKVVLSPANSLPF